MKGDTRSSFIQVNCSDCGNEQTVFSNTSTVVKCLVCDKIMAKPTGGKTHFEIVKKEKTEEVAEE